MNVSLSKRDTTVTEIAYIPVQEMKNIMLRCGGDTLEKRKAYSAVIKNAVWKAIIDEIAPLTRPEGKVRFFAVWPRGASMTCSACDPSCAASQLPEPARPHVASLQLAGHGLCSADCCSFPRITAVHAGDAHHSRRRSSRRTVVPCNFHQERRSDVPN